MSNFFAIWKDPNRLKNVFIISFYLIAINIVFNLFSNIPSVGILLSIITVIASVYVTLSFYLICFDGTMKAIDYLKLSVQCMKGHFLKFVLFELVNVFLPLCGILLVCYFIARAVLFLGLLTFFIVTLLFVIWAGLMTAGYYITLVPPYMVTGVPNVNYADNQE